MQKGLKETTRFPFQPIAIGSNTEMPYVRTPKRRRPVYLVAIEYENGCEDQVGDVFAGSEEACSDAIQLAEFLANAPGDARVPPKWVHVYLGRRREISISIIRGGLLGETVALGPSTKKKSSP